MHPMQAYFIAHHADDENPFEPDPNGRVFGQYLADLDHSIEGQGSYNFDGGPMGDGGALTEAQWFADNLKPEPRLGAVDGRQVPLMTAMIGVIMQMGPCFGTLTELTKKKKGMTFLKVLEIARGLPDMKDAEAKLEGKGGVYILLDVRKQEVQVGQSGDLAAMARDLASSKYKDYQQRILLQYHDNYRHTFLTRVGDKKLFAALLKQIKRPARFSDTHQPLAQERDDVKARRPFKDSHAVIAYACMHDAHWKGAREMGPLVPPLTLEQADDKVDLLVEILAPVIKRIEPPLDDPRKVVTLFREYCGKEGAGEKDTLAKWMEREIPWDPRGAETGKV